MSLFLVLWQKRKAAVDRKQYLQENCGKPLFANNTLKKFAGSYCSQTIPPRNLREAIAHKQYLQKKFLKLMLPSNASKKSGRWQEQLVKAVRGSSYRSSSKPISSKALAKSSMVVSPVTCACSVSRHTETDVTPGTDERAFSAALLQWAQLIPDMVKVNVCSIFVFVLLESFCLIK